MEQFVLKVVGDHKLHCSGCEKSVEFILSQLPGVISVGADYRNQRIEVNLESDTEVLDKLKRELALAGYKVDVV